jgi:hypothetical protein
MHRTRDWRREKTIRHKKRAIKRALNLYGPFGTESWDEHHAEMMDDFKKGVPKWVFGCDCSYCVGGRIEHKNRHNLPLDKELETWYDDHIDPMEHAWENPMYRYTEYDIWCIKEYMDYDPNGLLRED